MVVGEFTQETDLAVIGGGPAGYSAAFRAAALGQDVIVIDPRPHLGGLCLADGCIPSKTLLHLTQIMRDAQRAERMGVRFGEPTIDLAAVRSWIDRTIETLGKGLAARARELGIEHLHGQARFDDSRRLTVTNGGVSHVKFRRALIATGAGPAPHPQLPDDDRIEHASTALRFKSIAPSTCVIGDDYQACEIASIFAALGSLVTLISPTRLLPHVDDDLRKPLVRSLNRTLHAVVNEVAIDQVSSHDDAVRITMANGTVHDVAHVVYCGHLIGNTSALQLENTSVRCDATGHIKVDTHGATGDMRIYAAGDVTNGPPLANRALHQGRVAAECIAGWDSSHDPYVVPQAVFTDPNIAWCGLTERHAAGRKDLRVSRIRWGASGRAVGIDRAEGLTKIIFEPSTELVLGVGLVGPHAAEMIGEAALAIEMGATLTDLAETLHPHPTMSELVSEVSATEAQSMDEGPVQG